MTIATLVGSERLSAGDVAAASDAAAAAGGKPGEIRWIEAEKAAAFALGDGDWRVLRDSIELALPAADVFVQPDPQTKRVFVADMDSTMITVECIDELADYAGMKAEISAVTEAAMRGELDFAQALERRVALLEGLPVLAIDACLADRVTVSAGARTLVRTLRAHGVRTLLVSGGFTHFANPVAELIGFDEVLANVLEIRGDVLAGRVRPPIVDAAAKAAALRRLTDLAGVAPAASVAVGDGANDLQMVMSAGLGVAYHAKPTLAAAADARIRRGTLTAMLYAMGIARTAWVEA